MSDIQRKCWVLAMLRPPKPGDTNGAGSTSKMEVDGRGKERAICDRLLRQSFTFFLRRHVYLEHCCQSVVPAGVNTHTFVGRFVLSSFEGAVYTVVAQNRTVGRRDT